MTDERRLIDSGGASERALLGAARSLRANAASRRRALVSLGIASALSFAPATALAALKWLKGASLTLMGTPWGAGVIVATVAAGAVTAHVVQRADDREASAEAAQRAPTPAPVVDAKRPPVVMPVPEPAPTLQAPVPPAANPPIAPARSAALPSSPVISELELLDAARSQLRTGNASGALASLAEHQKVYPRGRMAMEARVLRIEALAAIGRREQALREARQFLEQSPNGLLSHRVRRWLDSQEK